MGNHLFGHKVGVNSQIIDLQEVEKISIYDELHITVFIFARGVIEKKIFKRFSKSKVFQNIDGAILENWPLSNMEIIYDDLDPAQSSIPSRESLRLSLYFSLPFSHHRGHHRLPLRSVAL